MYNYEAEKKQLFTDAGQRMFLAIRDNAIALARKSGAVRMQEAMHAGTGGDSWTMLACVDRMVELGELREIVQGSVAGQYRVFVLSGRLAE